VIKTFISHTSSDHPFVEWLKINLERENLGLDIFIDDGSIFVGDDPQKMIDEVKRSIIFIPILSNESAKKEFVKNEIKTAISNETTHIFPIKLKCKNENIPEEIKTKFSAFDKVEGKIYEDFSEEKGWDIHYENFRKAIFNKIVELGLFKEDTKDFYQDCEHLDLILKRGEPSIFEIKTVIDVLLKKESYQRYFFSKLDNPRWIKYLNLYGFLKNSPQTIESIESPGYYTIPHWYTLDYLEKISENLGSDNKEIINDLLEIIQSVSSIKDEYGKPIENYRTWYYFVKILLNIPNEKISFEIIDLIPTWLNSKFDTMLQNSEIATKLLSKFLPSNPTAEDIKKAEKIVDYITRVKWVKLPEKLREGILDKEEETKTVVDPYWLLESFVKQQNAAKVGEKCSEKIMYIIADRLKEILVLQRPIHWVDVELEDKIYRISVSHTKDYEFDCSVGIIKEEQLKTDKADESFIKNLSVTPEKLFSFEIIDCRNVEYFEEKIKTAISKSTIVKEIEDKLDDKLSHLYETIFSDYSYIWFRSISEGTGLTIHKTKETLTVILRDILLAKAKKDKSVAKNIFKEFMGDKYQYPLFKRLVLFAIGECWDDLKQEFWEIVNAKGGEQLFDDSNYEAEIYVLLEKNVMRFIQEEKERLKVIIEKGPQGFLPEDNRERYISYWKQKWYSAIKTDPDFTALYEEQRKLTQVEEELHFRGEKSRWGPGPSPLSKEDILRMPNQELAEFLRTFETKDHWKGPTIEGLGALLKSTVQEKPEKFIDDLTPFLNTFYCYIVEMLWGIRDAWNEKKAIDWSKLFDFIKQYIIRDEFWQDKFKIIDIHRSIADHKWVVGMIADLIQEGTKNDSWAFEEKYFSVAQEIIFLIIENLQVKEKEEIRDPVTHALNSPFGKIITALIYLALRIERLEDKKSEKRRIKWSGDLKNQYEALLKKEVIEAYTLFGQYMPNLYYLDKDWVEQKIKKLEDVQNEQLWSAFMNGYLFGSRVYDDLYRLMGKHYLKAMSYPFKEEHSEEGLVQHIAIGCLRNLEDLTENSLFGMMLKKWRPSHIREIIGFFWMQRDYLVRSIDKGVPIPGSDENEKVKSRIIDFWRWLYNQYKDEESLDDDDKKILSSVAKLTVFLPKIDSESFEWLIFSAQYINLDFNSPFFIESLDELKDKGNKIESGRYIGKIFLKMLDVFTPDYDEKHIRSIVEFLYDLKDGETIDFASKICNTYGSRGFEFLRDIYEKYTRI